MKNGIRLDGGISRRQFIGGAAAASAGIIASGKLQASAAQTAEKPDSNFGGVQIGAITYSWRSMPGTADDLLNYLVQCGINSVELMGNPAEEFAGAPVMESVPRLPRGQEMTGEQRARMQAARRKYAEDLRKWRLSVSMDKFKALRKKYNDAGVDIHIVKFGDIGGEMPHEEIEYCFNAAKALGARGITVEISEEKARQLGPCADRHNIWIGFHNHTQVNYHSWEAPFSFGRYLGMNFDIGHYVAGTNESPLPVIERYADAGRILSLHIKDRKVNNGPNMPFGQGDTPLALALLLMKKKQYTFPAHIELEYKIPEGSNAVEEVRKCVAWCREVLTR